MIPPLEYELDGTPLEQLPTTIVWTWGILHPLRALDWVVRSAFVRILTFHSSGKLWEGTGMFTRLSRLRLCSP